MENKLWKKGLILGIIVMLFGVSVIPSTGSVIILNYEQPDNVYVDDDFNESTPGWGYDHFDNIQDGVDAVNESGTIYVYNGTYYENIILNKTIDLIGENRDYTIIDGGGSGNVVNVSVDWVNISGFTIQNSGSVYLKDVAIDLRSNNNTIMGNNISNNEGGIFLEDSHNNNIVDNILSSNNGDGVHSDGSSGNNISYNIIISSIIDDGIDLSNSNYNNINGNYIRSNHEEGIYMNSSNNNIISNNNISYNDEGIRIEGSNNNTFLENTIYSNNWISIYCIKSNNNNINYNNISNNGAGVSLDYSDGNTILGNNITLNAAEGISLWWSSCKNTIDGNTITLNNAEGIDLYFSSNNNTITNNSITLNKEEGIDLNESSNHNIIYHNNLLNNTVNAADECNNTWDNGYPSGGNYWSDYPYNDDFNGPNQDIQGRDGIGDVPYEIPCEHGTDYYPLIKQNGWLHSPPNVPNKPSGETIILPGMSYPYNTSTIDPDNDSIWFKWDWGDGTFSDWLGPFDSGEVVSSTHIWAQGTYEIKVKAKDSRNPETDWSEPLTINAIYPNLKTVLLFGFITNRTKSTDYYSFNAGKVLWINFNPIFPDIYSSNELIIVSYKYFGILLNWFIFGFFNAMVLT